MSQIALGLDDSALAIARDGDLVSTAPSIVQAVAGARPIGAPALDLIRLRPRDVSSRHWAQLVRGEGDLAAQTTQVMHNLGLALKAAGASYSNIVKITTFVVGYKPELRPVIGKARSAFFEGMEPPASTLVGVTALAAPEWLIEIEAVAVVD